MDISEVLVGNASFLLSPGTENKMIKSGDVFLSDSLFLNNISDLFIKKEIQYSISKLKEDFEKSRQKHISDSILLQNIENTLHKELDLIKEEKPIEKAEDVKQKEFLLDTLIIKSINIDRFLISDSKVNIENSIEQKTGLTIPEIWFLAEGIKYDQVSAKESDHLLYSEHLFQNSQT